MSVALPKPIRRGPRPPKRIARTRPRKAKKTSRAADADWSQTVRWRDGYCRLRGRINCRSMPTDAHHVFGKKARPRLRHDLDNGIGLCREAHAWAHAQPRQFKAWFAATYPKRFARLAAKAQREGRLA